MNYSQDNCHFPCTLGHFSSVSWNSPEGTIPEGMELRQQVTPGYGASSAGNPHQQGDEFTMESGHTWGDPAARPRSRPGSRCQGCGASCAGRRAVHLAEKTQQLVQGQNMCCVARTTFLPELRTQAASCGSGGSRPSPWQPTWSRRMRKTDSSGMRKTTAPAFGETKQPLAWVISAPTIASGGL